MLEYANKLQIQLEERVLNWMFELNYWRESKCCDNIENLLHLS